jgi:hypothetical protein
MTEDFKPDLPDVWICGQWDGPTNPTQERIDILETIVRETDIGIQDLVLMESQFDTTDGIYRLRFGVPV